MDQGQAVQVAPTDVELERAIASVPGVVSAGIDRSATTGRSRMRLRLAPGEDEEAVAWSVVATLRERFGIALDRDAIRPRPAASSVPEDDAVHLLQGFDSGFGDPLQDVGEPRPRSANELADTRERLRLAAAQALHSADDPNGAVGLDDRDAGVGLRFRSVIPRAVIRDLQVRRDVRSVQVTVVLGHGGRAEEGRATSVPTSHGTLRAVAEAAVAALRGLAEGPLLVGIERVSANHGEDSPVATVVLSLLTRRGEERLLGGSIIHDSPERAVLRATLDALNRRVMPLLLDPDAER